MSETLSWIFWAVGLIFGVTTIALQIGIAKRRINELEERYALLHREFVAMRTQTVMMQAQAGAEDHVSQVVSAAVGLSYESLQVTLQHQEAVSDVSHVHSYDMSDLISVMPASPLPVTDLGYSVIGYHGEAVVPDGSPDGSEDENEAEPEAARKFRIGE